MNLHQMQTQGFKVSSIHQIEDGWYVRGILVNPENGLVVTTVATFDRDFQVHSKDQLLPSIISEEDGEVFFEWYNHGAFVKCGKNPTIESSALPDQMSLTLDEFNACEDEYLSSFSDQELDDVGCFRNEAGKVCCKDCEKETPCKCEENFVSSSDEICSCSLCELTSHH